LAEGADTPDNVSTVGDRRSFAKLQKERVIGDVRRGALGGGFGSCNG
jgi:hypothetical protein